MSALTRKGRPALSRGAMFRIAILSVPALASICFVLYLGFAPRAAAAALDARNCPFGRAPSDTILVLLDATDSLSPAQAASFRSTVTGILRTANRGELISIAEIQTLPVRFDVSLCSPERGSPPSFLDILRNPSLNWHALRAAWQRQFDRPMASLIARLLFSRVWPRSPIIQSIDDATRQLGHAWDQAGERKLIIFSDMMENTDEFSQYGDDPDRLSYAAARAQASYIESSAPFLKGAEIEIHYLVVPHDYKTQLGAARLAHENFWRGFFEHYGARISLFQDQSAF